MQAEWRSALCAAYGFQTRRCRLDWPHTKALMACVYRLPANWDNPLPILFWRQFHSYRKGTAKTETTAYSRGSHRHSSRRAVGRQWPRAFCRVD